ncbi:MAG TPA: hypothetical protein ENJ51_01955 [Leucothrix mucor]|uniref:Uncharacterized protein n=1 Tax=Leucothrix mucor TaxID=45248 RepID=A0A7V2SY01_LEUMU|nr:hypothetical protein [Leucothrix mucor]
MKTNFILATAATIVLTLSTVGFADDGHKAPEMDHSKMDHSKMDHSKMTPKAMEAMHKAMDDEMTKIINTVDINQRKKLFVAHKARMKSMQGMMKGNCKK